MKNALVGGIKAFFEVEEQESVMTTKVAKKASVLAVGRVVFAGADWVVAAGLGSMVFWMKAVGTFSTTDIWLTTFMYDLFASAIFFFLSDMTNCDFTLGQSFRRVADSLSKNGIAGKVFSGILLLGVSAKAIIWEGPEVICFLFKKELKTRSNIWLALFVLSALQGLFGAWLYTTGYNLWQKFASTSLTSHYILMGIATFACVALGVTLIKQLINLLGIVISSFSKK